MGLMNNNYGGNSNPYYGGNAFASAIDGALDGWNNAEDRRMLREKHATDLENQQAQLEIQQATAARAQAEADNLDRYRQASAAMNADKVNPYYENNTPQGWQAPMVSQDTQSNRLTPYGQGVQTERMGGLMQTTQQTPPMDNWQRGNSGPAVPQFTGQIQNAAYAPRLAEVQKQMQAQGSDTVKANPTMGQRLALMDSYDPIAANKERISIHNSDAKWDNLKEMITIKSDFATQMAATKDAAERDKIQIKYDNDIALQKEKYDLLKGVKIAGAGATAKKLTMNGLSSEQTDALSTAVAEGRLAPYKVNSRNQQFLADTAMKNPGIDLNGIEANMGLARNVGIQTKAGDAAMLPEMLKTTMEAGKKLNYANNSLGASAQMKWDQFTKDPAYRDFTVRRNDLIFRLGNVFKQNGMTDKAQMLEEDSGPKNMSPKELEAWFTANQDMLAPIMKKYTSQAQGKGTPLGDSAPPHAPSGNIQTDALAELQRRKAGRR